MSKGQSYGVQVKARTWLYLRPKEGLTKLWLHAMMFEDEATAERYAQTIRDGNPGLGVRIKPLFAEVKDAK